MYTHTHTDRPQHWPWEKSDRSKKAHVAQTLALSVWRCKWDRGGGGCFYMKTTTEEPASECVCVTLMQTCLNRQPRWKDGSLFPLVGPHQPNTQMRLIGERALDKTLFTVPNRLDVLHSIVITQLDCKDMWSEGRSHCKGFFSFFPRGLLSQRGLLTPLAPPTVELSAVVSRMICTCVKSKSPPGSLPGFPRLTHWASNTQVQTVAAKHNKLKTQRKEWQRKEIT